MDPRTYYNEFDTNAAQWLRNLQAAGQIAPGVVDERSIKEVKGADLAGVRRAHFFAGIGGWDLALRLAGWREDREVWTASCPCQPFSAAGKGGGTDDPRHLWPDTFRLIVERGPGTVFGEQVASKAGLGWLDGVLADMEGEGYTCGAAIVGAHSVGAPHIRQRLYWVADRGMAKDATGVGRRRGSDGDQAGDDGQVQAQGLRAPGGMGDNQGEGRNEPGRNEYGSPEGGESTGLTAPADEARRMADGPHGNGRAGEFDAQAGARPDGVGGRRPAGGSSDGPWSDYRIIPCTDGKARRTGARVFPLAHGIPRGMGGGGSWRKGLARSASRARVGMLKGSGNAIVPDLAAEFIGAFLDCEEGR